MNSCSTPKPRSHDLAEPANAESLGRVVAGSDEMEPAFASVGHRVLGRLAREERVEPEPTASAIDDEPAPERIPSVWTTAWAGVEDERLAARPGSNALDQVLGGDALGLRARRSRSGCPWRSRRLGARLEARAPRRGARCCRSRGGRPAGGGRRRRQDRSQRGPQALGHLLVQRRGWNSQKRPWWAMSSSAPASIARSSDSRWADTRSPPSSPRPRREPGARSAHSPERRPRRGARRRTR